MKLNHEFMKKYLLIIPLIIIGLKVFSQEKKLREFYSTPNEYGIQTDEFTVLDINFENNLLAFKQVYRRRPWWNDMFGDSISEPCNCHYDGMDSVPYSGVILGVYNLSTQDYLKAFKIYNSTYDLEDCTQIKLSMLMLDSAKQYFLENKLDITQNPKPINLRVKVKNDKMNKFKFNNILFAYNSVKDYDSDLIDMVTMSELFTYSRKTSKNYKLIYTIYQEDYYFMASGGKIEYLSVFEKDEKFVFLNAFYFENHQAGGTTGHETYHFSPVFKLSDFK